MIMVGVGGRSVKVTRVRLHRMAAETRLRLLGKTVNTHQFGILASDWLIRRAQEGAFELPKRQFHTCSNLGAVATAKHPF